MLKQPVPPLSRWLAGSSAVIALTLAVGMTAWAAQPSKPAARPPAPPSPPAAPAAPSAPTALHEASWIAAPPPPAPPESLAPPPPPPPPAPLEQPVLAVGALVPPRYPASAATGRIGGRVVLIIDVDAHGDPANVVVERSEPAGVFDQNSVEAAKKWKFQPAVENGHPVAGRIRVPIDFAPDDPAPAGTPAKSAMLSSIRQERG